MATEVIADFQLPIADLPAGIEIGTLPRMLACESPFETQLKKNTNQQLAIGNRQ
jgi:hypothetical protein